MLNDQKDDMPSRPPVQGGRGSRFALIFFILVSGLFIAYFVKNDKPVTQEVPYSTFVMRLERNEVDAVKIIDGNEIQGAFKSSNGDLVQFRTLIPYQDPQLIPLLKEKGVRITGSVSGISPMMIFLEFLPWLIGFVFIWLMFRNAQGAGNKAFQFGKSRAKRYLEVGKRITFADVAGQEEAKYELQEVVAFLKNPQKFTKMG
ncbi:MAG: ATP-dependent metallopeptidase FtsH/Yme1/Tma family protein, partial [Treponema sp.]|nr:ATP-dependent metallopeptidase FtsH/Yme1/Tma family protein [Treponema sp.]